jgi:hypothetical protein
VSARHVATHGVFGPPTSVVCVTDFPPEINIRGELVTVRAAGKEVALKAEALPAVRLLLSGAPVSVAETSAMTGVDATELAEAFVAGGICGELTDVLAAGYLGWLS